MKRTIQTFSLLLTLLLTTGPSVAQNSDSDAIRQSYRYESNGKYQQALKAMAGMSEVQSSYFLTLRRGWLLYLTGQYADSASAYTTAAKKAPKSIEPLLGKMLPLMALRRWKDAATVGQKIIKSAPKNYLANSRIAWCDYNLGRFAEAKTRYQNLLALYPADVEMRAGYGWALLKQGQKPQAKQQFNAVLAISPDHASARAGLALAQ